MLTKSLQSAHKTSMCPSDIDLKENDDETSGTVSIKMLKSDTSKGIFTRIGDDFEKCGNFLYQVIHLKPRVNSED